MTRWLSRGFSGVGVDLDMHTVFLDRGMDRYLRKLEGRGRPRSCLRRNGQGNTWRNAERTRDGQQETGAVEQTAAPSVIDVPQAGSARTRKPAPHQAPDHAEPSPGRG